jgi:FtsZ-binding cell division protein ZapB
MKDKKLTDKEIAKALECAIRNDCDCNCVFLLPNKVQDVLDLINRLQAENERLKNDLAISRKETKRYKTAKAEAYKEFADRVKEKLGNTNLAIRFIDNLLKELVGE